MSIGLSARRAAKELGLAHSAVLKAAKTGRISREADKSFIVEKVRRELAENTNVRQQRKPISLVTGLHEVGNGVRTFAEAQRQREWTRVEKEKLALKRIQGEMASIGEINAHVAGMIIRAREVLTRMAPELKDRLAQETNPHECERLLASEITRALAELREFQRVETVQASELRGG